MTSPSFKRFRWKKRVRLHRHLVAAEKAFDNNKLGKNVAGKNIGASADRILQQQQQQQQQQSSSSHSSHPHDSSVATLATKDSETKDEISNLFTVPRLPLTKNNTSLTSGKLTRVCNLYVLKVLQFRNTQNVGLMSYRCKTACYHFF